MFNRKRIKNLEEEIQGLKNILKSYGLEYRRPVNFDLPDYLSLCSTVDVLKRNSANQSDVNKIMNHLNLEFYTEPAKSGIREKK